MSISAAADTASTRDKSVHLCSKGAARHIKAGKTVAAAPRLGFTDKERVHDIMKGIEGKRLTYRSPDQTAHH